MPIVSLQGCDTFDLTTFDLTTFDLTTFDLTTLHLTGTTIYLKRPTFDLLLNKTIAYVYTTIYLIYATFHLTAAICYLNSMTILFKVRQFTSRYDNSPHGTTIDLKIVLLRLGNTVHLTVRQLTSKYNNSPHGTTIDLKIVLLRLRADISMGARDSSAYFMSDQITTKMIPK